MPSKLALLISVTDTAPRSRYLTGLYAQIIFLCRLENTTVSVLLILKVPHDSRQHTDHDLDRIRHSLIKGRCGGDSNRVTLSICSFEDIARELTHHTILRVCRLRHCPLNVATLVVHVPHLIAHHQTQVGLLVKVQADLIGVEGDLLRLYKLHRSRADHLIALAQRHGDNTDAVSIGREQAGGRVDRAQRCGVLRQLPHQAVGQVRRAAAAVHAYRAELHGRAGGIQLLTGADHGVVKHTVLNSGRNAQEAGADGPLLSVGGLAEHFQLTALFPGGKGGGDELI